MKSKSSKDEEKIETVKEEEPTVSTPEEEIQKLKSEVEDYNEKFYIGSFIFATRG